MRKLQNIQRVAVLGAGPAGIAVAKYLVAERKFTHIDIFEQRSTCAGLWNYSSENDREVQFAVPQTDPYNKPEKPVWRCDHEKNPRNNPSEKHATFLSPLYERLESNLPKMIMQHSDMPFPDDNQLFPTHENVTAYLERYADDVRHFVQFETQVLNVQAKSQESGQGWSVTTQSLTSGNQTSSDYDAVAVTSGHFLVPFIPDVPGIREWNQAYHDSITHSKFFRRPEDFKHKKVLTIGTGSSGADIAAQINLYCVQPLLVSSRSSSPSDTPSRRHLPGLAEFLPHSRSIRFADGQVISEIDSVVFCTGYLYSYPFLSSSPLPTAPLLSNGTRTENLYQHIFYNADPTLAFIGLPKNIVPFPICQAQGAVVAGAWVGRLALPERGAMQEWEQQKIKQKGDGQRFHLLPTPEDGNYLNMLHDWATGDGANKQQHVNGGSKHAGKAPPYWGEKDLWIRERIGEIKRAFSDLGEERRHVRTLEELGFDFEQWKRDQGNGVEKNMNTVDEDLVESAEL